jgi:cbb3-type cytochrome oxidase subunit 3
MFQDILSSIDNVGLMPSITFLAFFIFFIGVTVLVLLRDKKEIKEMSELPLKDN